MKTLQMAYDFDGLQGAACEACLFGNSQGQGLVSKSRTCSMMFRRFVGQDLFHDFWRFQGAELDSHVFSVFQRPRNVS